MRPALCLAATALAAGLTGCSADGPTLAPVAATSSTPAPVPAVVTPVPTTPAATTSAPRTSRSAAPVTTAPAAARTTPTATTTTTTTPTTSAPAAPTTPTTTAPEQPEDPLVEKPGLESAPPAGLPTCRAGALSVTDADAVYTTDAVQELFTIRTTGRDCQLEGYPTVSLLDEAGRELPAQVRRNGYGMSAHGPEAVTLSKGTSVSFSVATSRDGDCQQAATLVTTLPGTGAALRAGTPMQVCDTAVGVTPVRRLVDDHELHE